ncbi:MAG: hypothetical protein IKA47_12840 [Oscillospiraceae bacterium]|nr:hypothetical protein [Oscillospiraceae bacterium]
MKRRIYSAFFLVVAVIGLLLWQTTKPATATAEETPFVTTAATTQDEVLTAINTASYIQLGADLELTLSGQSLVVDLAGYNLTLKGMGTVYGFDTANDTFDHLQCGVLTAESGIICESVYVATNGNRYVALTEGSYTTFHRLDMEIKTVSLRMSNAGLYYKAFYQCDRQVEEKVTAYGMAVSLADVPGTDFKTAESDFYTVSADKFVSGTTVTSGSVVGILKEELTPAENLKRSRMPLYANAYIDLGNGPIVADTENVGKKAGTKASLMQVLAALDSAYSGYSAVIQGQLDDFVAAWSDVNFNLVNIGKEKKVVDNSNLVFDAGTTDAYCPVCEKKVTWIALTTAQTTAANGSHYYLAEDLTHTGDGDYFFRAPTTGGHKACLHLNGHNMTATATRAIHGSSGILNVMGNGNVTGYNKKISWGAAVMVNNKNVRSQMNLYGGTYLKSEDASTTWPAVMIGDAGGRLTIHKDVVIGNDTGYALKTCQNKYADSYVSLQGCTVNGPIVMETPKTETTNKTNLELLDARINGYLQLPAQHALTLSGKVYIKKLIPAEDAKVIIKSLEEGSSIRVDCDGIFTTASAGIAKYLGYFKAYTSGEHIKVKDNALHCGPDYTSDLSFAEGTTDAWCPVCSKTVTWTALAGGTESVVLAANSHYYLPEDVNYTGSGSAYITAENATKTSCIHLNGHNLTSATRAIFGSSCTINVMGTGIVSGAYSAKDSTYGCTVMLNNKNDAACINLFSGTFRQAEGVNENQYTVNAQGAGGTINIYEDALIEGNINGKALRVGYASLNNIAVNVYGATVDGDTYLVGAQDASAFTVSVKLDGAKITGTLDVNGVNNLTVAHDVQIGSLDMEPDTKLTLDRLMTGADITVVNPGNFTNTHTKAAEYLQYFTTVWRDDKILSKDDVLRYKVNYTAGLLLNANNEAYCPVCKKIVVWQAVADDSTIFTFTDGGHWYLNRDMTYTGEDTVYMRSGAEGTVTCLNLNGYNITATKASALFVSSGYLNVMGDGVVTGYATKTGNGAALFTNNKKTTNGASLYSGTYLKGNSSSGAAVIGLQTNGGTLRVYEDAIIDARSNGTAISTGPATGRLVDVLLDNATVKGNVVIPAGANSVTFSTVNTTINGTVTVSGTPSLRFSGRTQIGKLNLAAGAAADFDNMLEGSSIKVSAEGTFSSAMTDADEWIDYFTTDDAGDWIIVRDKAFYQGVKTDVTVAEQSDIEALLAAYSDRVVRYGELHNHSSSGPRADGNKSIAKIKAEMERLGIDFYTLVDHRQSAHMYDEAWDTSMFIGGSETSSNIADRPAGKNSPHYNLVFADAAKFEQFIANFNKCYYYADQPEKGVTFNLHNMTMEELREMSAIMREYDGMLVHVHPKYISYIVSDDPLDYYFGEYTGIEIMTTGSSDYDASHIRNQDAYKLWRDLLDLGKKVYATHGNDNHRLPNINSLSAVYTSEKDADEYMERLMTGDFAPGWVGIRMQIGDATMGGTTNFEGQRLVFSAGDMFAAKYDATHEYVIRLYDDGGLLMESALDPTGMSYYAIDADPEVRFYRVEVFDLTLNQYVAVGNPIWNG